MHGTVSIRKNYLTAGGFGNIITLCAISIRTRQESEIYGLCGLCRALAETFTWFMTTPVGIFDCLTQARTNEKERYPRNARAKCSAGSPPVDPPPECSDQTIAKYYRQAARMYEAAATYAVLRHDLCRAFNAFARPPGAAPLQRTLGRQRSRGSRRRKGLPRKDGLDPPRNRST